MAKSRIQPAANVLDANFRQTFIDDTANIGRINKALGIEGVDDMLAITSDGTLNIRSRDDADGAKYTGPSVSVHSEPIPTIRNSGPCIGKSGCGV